LEEIGAGAFGVVYRAYQPVVGREVAIKIIHPRYANHADFIRRFEAEAQTVARLEHPYIVPLYDYWREPGSAYLVMRWLRAGSLEERLAHGPLSPEEAAGVVDQIAAALYAAHRRHIIHRDLKAANILFDEEGSAYLSDFSVAKDLLTREEPLEAVTSSAYLSPEQLLGESLSPRTDQYSLCIVIFQMLSGSSPFPRGASEGELRRLILHDSLPLLAARVPGMSRAIEDVLQRATAKKPDDRFPDMIALARAFHTAAGATAVAVETAEEVPLAGGAVEAEAGIVLNPYKGLRAFQESDADTFFGREALVEELLRRLEEDGDVSRFLAVVGPSGSGKSSAVKAGLIPALRGGAIRGSDSWFITEMTPGRDPLQELQAALLRVAVDPPADLLNCLQDDKRGLTVALEDILPSDDGDKTPQLLLLVDQFEELFTLTADEASREHFINSLLAALNAPHSRLRLITTLRADFYDRPLQVMGLGALLRERTEVVLPLSPAELERAITQPAVLAGVSLEPGLLAGITADVSDQPGTLPLMQYALTELFERREDGLMTLDSYQDIGGVPGALGRRADEIYQGLSPTEQEAARQMFLRLITLGEGAEDTRRRVLREELEAISIANDQQSMISDQLSTDGGQHSALHTPHSALDNSAISSVIDTFGQYRLLTFDRDPATRGPTVEVGHEALLREWPQLRNWLDESRADVRLQRLLAAESAGWQKSGQDEAYLLRGARLEQYDGWLEETSVSLTDDEKTFLAASFAAREARLAEEEARRQRELETARQHAEQQAEAADKLRRRALILAGALAIAALLAVAAIFFANQSSQNAQVAEQHAAAAEQNAITAQENAQLAETREAEAVANADLAAASEANALAEAEQRATAQAEADEQRDAAVIAQEEAVAEAEQRATAEAVAVQEQRTAEEQARLASSRELAAAAVNSLEEDQERAVLLALQALDQVHTQEAEDALHQTAQELRLLRTLDAPGRSTFVAASPDGRRLVTSGPAGAAVWDMATGEIEHELDVGHWLNRAAFSPDGTLLVLPHENTSEENPEGYQEPSAVSIVDVATGEEIHTFLAHDAWVQDVSFSPDGTLFATASGDGTSKVWDLAAILAGESQERLSLAGGETFFWTVDFNSDGTRLATTNNEGIVQIWDAETGQELLSSNANSYGLSFSPDGTRLVTGNEEIGTLDVYDVATGQRLSRTVAHDGSARGVVFSPDGTRLASTGGDSLIKVWAFSEDALSPLLTLAGHKGRVGALDFSPDGEWLVSGSSSTTDEDPLVRIWDISPNGSLEPIFYPHNIIVDSVSFNADGSRLATADVGGNFKIWDAISGQELFNVEGHDWIWRLSYSPDGNLLASAGRDGLVKLWDAASGRELAALEDHVIPDEEEFYRGVLGLDFSPDSSRLVTAGDDGRVRIWDVDVLREGDLNSGGALFTLEDDRQAPFGQVSMDVAFSPDGRWIAASITNWANEIKNYGDGVVNIWDAATGELVWTIGDGDGKAYNYVTYSPDGKRLAADTLLESQVIVWRLPDDTAEIPQELFANPASKTIALKMSFSPDGTQLTVPHADGMGIWDAYTGEFLRSIPHPASVMETAYSPDGKRLATAGFDGNGRQFILDVDELRALAQARLTSSLTDGECRQFLHLETCPAEQ
jgi:WD40 repeat protein